MPIQGAEDPTEVQSVVSPGSPFRAKAAGMNQAIRAKAGDVLRRRYRLDELLVTRAESQTWRAFDEMLARPVIIHLLPAEGSNDDILAAARRAAVAADHRFLRVLDATIPAPSDVPDDSGIGPYIVCEHASGESLAELLAAGPLSTLEAAWLVREVARALSGMHSRGRYHQRLSPASVVITADGNVKIVGFLLEAEMAPDTRPDQDAEAADVQALGRLLYAALVARWPAGRDHGLAAAPTSAGGHPRTPLQVNPSVSPSLDRICARILGLQDAAITLRTAAEIAGALSSVLGTADASHDLEKRVQPPVLSGSEETLLHEWPDIPAQPVPSAARPARHQGVAPVAPRRRQQRAPWLRLVLTLVVALVLIGGLVLFVLQQAPTPGPSDEAGAAQVAGPSEQWPVVAAQDFDPEGNGEEHPRQVPLAWDGDPNTSWRTMNYWEGDIGNKIGVGLIFDLGEVRQLERVELDLDGNGTSLEVRIPAAEATDQAPVSSINQWTVVGGAQRTPSATSVTLEDPVETRYVLIYLTELPADGSAFTGGIAEARFWS